MAVTVTSKFHGNGAAAASFTTASWTPDITKQYLLGVVTYVSTGSVQPPTPTISGNGLTWTLLQALDYDTSGADRSSMWLFACSGAAGTTGTMGIAFSTTTPKASWFISEVDGASTNLGSGTLAQPPQTNQGAAATTLAVTLSALQSGSSTFGVLGWQATAGTMSAGGAYVQLATESTQSLAWGQTEWAATGSTTVDVGMSAGANRSGLIGIEIAVPGGSTINGTGTATGAGTVTTAATVLAPGAPSGLGTVTGNVTLGSSGSGTGLGVVTPAATLLAPGTATGLGTVTSKATLLSPGTAAGVGSVSSLVTILAPGTATGAGVATGQSGGGTTINGVGVATGAGVVTAKATLLAPGAATGLGAVTSKLTMIAIGTAIGAGVATGQRKTAVSGVIWDLSEPAEAWSIVMLDERRSILSDGFVRFRIARDHQGLPYNPTGAAVSVAYLSAWGNPQPSDFHAAAWSSNYVGGYIAYADPGPTGANLQRGSYYVWVKIVDNILTETPVSQVGRLTVQ